MGEKTTIPVYKETRDLLKKMGRKDETWDDLIRRLMREVEEK